MTDLRYLLYLQLPIIYNYKGISISKEITTFETTCDLDITYYPFDHQTCDIVLGAYDQSIVILPDTSKDHLERFKGHGSWRITKYEMIKGKASLKIRYVLVRKPEFLIMNVLLPILFLALLNPLVFVLPVFSGERIGFAITALLAVSVYMTILGDYLPRNSNPLISYMLTTWLVISASIVVFVIFSMHIYHIKDSKRVPWLAQAFVRSVRRVCFRRQKIESASSNEKKTWLNDEDRKAEGQPRVRHGDSDAIVVCDKANNDDEEFEVNRISWRNVSGALDRCVLIGIYTVQILFIIIFLSILALNGERTVKS